MARLPGRFGLGFLALVCGAACALAEPPRPSPQSVAPGGKPALRVQGRHFVDTAGRAVLLRGVNVSGGAKVPPFRPVRSAADLDPLPALGFNVIRLVFIWEAFEPTAGAYDEAYLDAMWQVAEAAWARGLYVIIDNHQDGFSRYSSRGAGDGFPPWALSPDVRPARPDNGASCKNWPLLMATDRGMHRSFDDFYADRGRVRTRYLEMLRHVAARFAAVPGVIGYDLMNEPWGDEAGQIGPLYRDAAVVIRASDPTAILFLEGHITTNSGLQTALPRPDLANFAYAPHFYDPVTLLRKKWQGRTATIDRAFANMTAKAEEWGVPLFLGEFGAPADAGRAGAYVGTLYDRLDAALASGAQWNFTPTWTERDKDGWNAEDFHILDARGLPRPNFTPHPYPKVVAGVPLGFGLRGLDTPGCPITLDLLWHNEPNLGATEIFLPARWFPAGTTAVSVDAPGATFHHDPARQTFSCSVAGAGQVRLRLTGVLPE